VTEPNWLSADEMRLFRAFLSSTSGITSRLDAHLKNSSGIALDDYEVLVMLSEAPDQRVRMSELSDMLLHSRSRLSQRVDRLVGRDYVERERCDDDARGTWAVLTSQGIAALRAAAPHHVAHVRAHMFDHIDPSDITMLMTAFERLAAGVRD
jgi:DNA-binding MarR family transcriptional regulator